MTREKYVKRGRGAEQTRGIGYVSELLAVADMNTRVAHLNGFSYLNPVPQTADDAFVKSSNGWLTVQVRTAKLCRTKGGVAMRLRRDNSITSDIVALVDDSELRIKYLPNAVPLPPEFPAEPTPICKGLVYLNNPEEAACADTGISLP